MLFWIFAALAVYLISAYSHSVFLVSRIGLEAYLGSRDNAPDDTAILGRATRATANMAENMMIFVPLALLSFVVEGTDQAMALLGAQIFVIGRALYLPSYLAAIPVGRSVIFTVALLGLGLMAVALV